MSTPSNPEKTQDGHVGSGALLGRMSWREKTLLRECCEYAISTVGKGYYRLGGHGCVSMRYHPATLRNLEAQGLVEHCGYWQATQKGKELMRPNAAYQPAGGEASTETKSNERKP